MRAVDTFTEQLESIVASVRSMVDALPLPPDSYPQFYVERSGDDVVLLVLKALFESRTLRQGN